MDDIRQRGKRNQRRSMAGFTEAVNEKSSSGSRRRAATVSEHSSGESERGGDEGVDEKACSGRGQRAIYEGDDWRLFEQPRDADELRSAAVLTTPRRRKVGARTTATARMQRRLWQRKYGE